MFRFENGMNVLRTQLEGNVRVDETRWFRLDIDLNYPLPGQDMAEPYDLPTLTLGASQSRPVEVNSQIQKQPATDVELIDNEVSIISPTLFAEARKRPRRDDDADKENTQIAPATEQPPQAPVFRCPICMGNLKEATSTKCGHIFCKECIEAAITYRKRCPTCRKRFRGKATFRIYLPTLN